MRDFHCPNCGQRLTFENSACLACGSALGFSLDQMALLVIAKGDDSDHTGAVAAETINCAPISMSRNAIGLSPWIIPAGCASRAR